MVRPAELPGSGCPAQSHTYKQCQPHAVQFSTVSSVLCVWRATWLSTKLGSPAPQMLTGSVGGRRRHSESMLILSLPSKRGQSTFDLFYIWFLFFFYLWSERVLTGGYQRIRKTRKVCTLLLSFCLGFRFVKSIGGWDIYAEVWALAPADSWNHFSYIS